MGLFSIRKENKELRERNRDLEDLLINVRGELKAAKMELESANLNNNFNHNASEVCKGCKNLIVTSNKNMLGYEFKTYLCKLDNQCEDKEY